MTGHIRQRSPGSFELRWRLQFVTGLMRDALLDVAAQVDRVHEIVQQRDIARNRELFRMLARQRNDGSRRAERL